LKKHFDYICIGAGSGGIASANRAAQQGACVALIEVKDLGGTCVNVGCVPKKIMWHGAQIKEWLTHYAPDYGFEFDYKSFSWQKLTEQRQAYIARVHASYERVLGKNKVEHIQGYGRFIDAQTVEVNGIHYSADHILIAAGAKPSIPQIPGCELGIDSDGFFALQEQPKRVLIIGAGYIAVELAGVLHALGSQTHLAVRKEKALRSFDEMLSDTLMEIMHKEGLHVHTKHRIERLERLADQSITAHFYDQESINIDCVIWAVGREPATQNLGLERIGVQTDPQGHIVVDAHHQTSVPCIYAVGDNTNKGVQLTPVAVKAGRLLAMRLFSSQKLPPLDYDHIPTVVFSHPPIGTLGLTEQEARAQYDEQDLKIYRSEFTAMLSGATSNRQITRMKLICVGKDERIVGLHGIGFAMDEILQGFAVAIKMKATKADFDSVIAIHPTSAEEWVTMT